MNWLEIKRLLNIRHRRSYTDSVVYAVRQLGKKIERTAGPYSHHPYTDAHQEAEAHSRS